LSVVLVAVTWSVAKKLFLGVISEDLAKSAGIPTRKTNLIYYLLVGTVVALGVKFISTILMGALVIIPAATAKNFSRNLLGYQAWAVIIGAVSSIFGIVYSQSLGLPTGPIVVLTSVFFFILTYLARIFSRP
jgi:zinc transport system permease protein